MAEITKIRRLAASGTVQFDGNVNVVKLAELIEGGEFDLHPFATASTANADSVRVYLPAPDAPGYGVAIEGDLGSLGRFARAILSLERKGKDGEVESAPEQVPASV